MDPFAYMYSLHVTGIIQLVQNIQTGDIVSSHQEANECMKHTGSVVDALSNYL